MSCIEVVVGVLTIVYDNCPRIVLDICLRLGYFILPDYPYRSEVEFLSGVGWGGWVGGVRS